jgi:hypothetical protein
MRKYLYCLAACLLYIGCSSLKISPEKDENIVIGFLENQEKDLGYKENTNNIFLRVAFNRTIYGWNSFSSPEEDYPSGKCLKFCQNNTSQKQTGWIVIFNGKTIGNIKTLRPYETNYISETCICDVDKHKTLPRISPPSLDFSGWIGQPVYRPLVVLKKPYYADPEKWSKTDPPKDIWVLVLKEFRKVIDKVRTLKEQNNVTMEISYEDKDILLSGAYVSNKGEYLLSLHLNPDLTKHDVTVLGFNEWSDHLFYITQDRFVKLLIVNHRDNDSYAELKFLDAGDYDDDGRSEIIYFLSSYNEDGYVLFYDGFFRNEVYTWSYH